MKINKNSWHYKLVDHFDHNVVPKLIYNENVTLCQYFWSVVGAMFKAVVVAGGAVVVAALTIAFIICIFSSVMFLLIPLTGTFLDYKIYEFGIIFLAAVLLTVTVVSMMATVAGDMKVVPDWMKSNTTEKEDKQPSLLWSWIKAKKDKVCPLVSLEGEE